MICIGSLVDFSQAVWNKTRLYRNSLWMNYIHCFSLWSNFKELTRIGSKGQFFFTCICGIRWRFWSLVMVNQDKSAKRICFRFVSMLNIMLLHWWLSHDDLQVKGKQGDFGVVFETVMTGGMFAVDTFFFISGLLCSYQGFIQLENNRFNPIVNFLRRYYRYSIYMTLDYKYDSETWNFFQIDLTTGIRNSY